MNYIPHINPTTLLSSSTWQFRSRGDLTLADPLVLCADPWMLSDALWSQLVCWSSSWWFNAHVILNPNLLRTSRFFMVESNCFMVKHTLWKIVTSLLKIAIESSSIYPLIAWWIFPSFFVNVYQKVNHEFPSLANFLKWPHILTPSPSFSKILWQANSGGCGDLPRIGRIGWSDLWDQFLSPFWL